VNEIGEGVLDRVRIPLLAAAAIAVSLCGCLGPSYAPRPKDAQPATFEFRLGPGDRIGASVWGEQKLSIETEIGPDGAISFPLIGHTELLGLTVDEARVAIAKKLKAHYKDPVVSVALLAMRSRVVHVLGEVVHPGNTPFARGATVVSAIEAAGGYITATADVSEVRVVRDRMTNPRVFRLDLGRVLAAEEQDIYLEPGDVIYVPARGLVSWNRALRNLVGSDPSEKFEKPR
jgi:polysaccharide export outer membrane protein